MNSQVLTLRRRGSAALAFVCAIVIGPADALAYAWYRAPAAAQSQTYPWHQPQQPQPTQAQAATIPADQLDSLVAPIALYPDPLLAQTLAASTYPLEISQLQQFLTAHPGLQGQALADAVARQPWDPSVQALAALPDVVYRLSSNLQWTTDLGNAFLAQESDVMNAIQRMRQKAENTGALKSTPQQTVETQVVQNREVIVIEEANPQTVYVPWYNPVGVYGEPVYPYPSIYYPTGGYWTGAAIGFGLGVARGAFWGSGGWGWNVGWGNNAININRNANFIRNSNFYRNGNFNTWRHNAVHRGGVGYANRATAARFGGTYRGQALSNRGAVARQQLGRQGGNLAGARRSGAVGTSGSFNRGDFNRGNFNRGNFNRGDFGSRNFNRGNFNRGNFNYGNYNRGNFNRGSFNRGDFNRGNFSSKHFNRGNFGGSRSFSRGNFGGGRSFGGGGRSLGGGGRSFGGGGRRGGGRR